MGTIDGHLGNLRYRYDHFAVFTASLIHVLELPCVFPFASLPLPLPLPAPGFL